MYGWERYKDRADRRLDERRRDDKRTVVALMVIFVSLGPRLPDIRTCRRGGPLSWVMAVMRVAGGGRPAGLPRGAALQQGPLGVPQGSAMTPRAYTTAPGIPNQFGNDYQ